LSYASNGNRMLATIRALLTYLIQPQVAVHAYRLSTHVQRKGAKQSFLNNNGTLLFGEGGWLLGAGHVACAG